MQKKYLKFRVMFQIKFFRFNYLKCAHVRWWRFSKLLQFIGSIPRKSQVIQISSMSDSQFNISRFHASGARCRHPICHLFIRCPESTRAVPNRVIRISRQAGSLVENNDGVRKSPAIWHHVLFRVRIAVTNAMGNIYLLLVLFLAPLSMILELRIGQYYWTWCRSSQNLYFKWLNTPIFTFFTENLLRSETMHHHHK